MKRLVYLILFIVVYSLFINIFDISSYILPSIIDIIKEFISDFKSLVVHSIYTLVSTILGLLLAILCGFSLAILIDKFVKLKFFLNLVHMMQMIPTIVIAPLLIIWFGFGIGSIVFIVFVSCIFPIIVSINNGFNSIDEDYIHFFKINNITQIDTYIKLKIPVTINHIRSSLKIVSTYAITSCILAEYMVGQQGLGVYLAYSLTSFNIASAFLVVILTLIYTLILKYVINATLNIILRRIYGKII